MPRTEARIFTSIWNDRDFLALPPGAQRLYMFLLSQPRADLLRNDAATADAAGHRRRPG